MSSRAEGWGEESERRQRAGARAALRHQSRAEPSAPPTDGSRNRPAGGPRGFAHPRPTAGAGNTYLWEKPGHPRGSARPPCERNPGTAGMTPGQLGGKCGHPPYIPTTPVRGCEEGASESALSHLFWRYLHSRRHSLQPLRRPPVPPSLLCSAAPPAPPPFAVKAAAPGRAEGHDRSLLGAAAWSGYSNIAGEEGGERYPVLI